MTKSVPELAETPGGASIIVDIGMQSSTCSGASSIIYVSSCSIWSVRRPVRRRRFPSGGWKPGLGSCDGVTQRPVHTECCTSLAFRIRISGGLCVNLCDYATGSETNASSKRVGSGSLIPGLAASCLVAACRSTCAGGAVGLYVLHSLVLCNRHALKNVDQSCPGDPVALLPLCWSTS